MAIRLIEKEAGLSEGQVNPNEKEKRGTEKWQIKAKVTPVQVKIDVDESSHEGEMLNVYSRMTDMRVETMTRCK